MQCAECGQKILLKNAGFPCPSCGSVDRYTHIEEDFDVSDKVQRYDVEAREELTNFFEENSTEVFYSKQVEVIFEKKYYHWVTNRALRFLEGSILNSYQRKLEFGGTAKFYYHNSNRYYKRNINKAAKLIDEFSEADFVAGLGQTGELLVNEGFTRYGFGMLGRNTNELEGKKWQKTGHNLDFIFERDSIRYGVEVKNTLGYMDKDEFDVKILICKELDVLPLFVNRMMPSSFMEQLRVNNGIWMIMKYQLYPITHKKLADKVKREMRLPVDAPKAIYDGTMERLLRQHKIKLSEFKKNSQ
ncbi:MAG: hypothetical protein HYW01_06300 [Deltaproteobacteria bacterium]|nr:hypothetical protein [Deltaproteobacteria bacterium]